MPNVVVFLRVLRLHEKYIDILYIDLVINYSYTLLLNLVSLQVKILIRNKKRLYSYKYYLVSIYFLPASTRAICSSHFEFGGHLAPNPLQMALGTRLTLKLVFDLLQGNCKYR